MRTNVTSLASPCLNWSKRSEVTKFVSAIITTCLILFSGQNTFSQTLAPAPSGRTFVLPSLPTDFWIDGYLRQQPDNSGATTVYHGDWLQVDGGGSPANTWIFDDLGNSLKGVFAIHKVDQYSSTTDNIFSGNNKSETNPNSWSSQTTGSNVSSKADINNALIYLAKDNTGDTWGMFSGDRLSTTATTAIEFEFLQKKLTWSSTTNTFSSQGTDNGRTVGDIMISLSFNGSSPAVFLAFRWDGSNYQPIDLSTLTNSAFGLSNTSTISAPSSWAFGGNSYGANQFVEGAINLSDVVHDVNNQQDPCQGISVKTIFVKTKESNNLSTELADFVEPIQVDFNIGSSSISYNNGNPICSGTNPVNVTFGVNSVTTVGSFSVAKPDNTYGDPSGLSIDGNGTITPATSTPGKYQVQFLYSPVNGCSKTATADVVIQPLLSVPSITAPICAGATSVSGTSSEADGTIITVYKGGSSIGTTTVSGGAWTLSSISPALASGDQITATASASGKCTSAASTGVTVSANSAAPTVSSPICAGATSVSGTNVSGATVEVFVNGTSAGAANVSGTSWTKTVTALSAGDIVTAKATESGKCTSAASTGVTVSANSAAPTISSPICAGATSVSGTNVSGATVEVFVNGTSAGAANVSGTSWTKTVSALSAGDIVSAKATEPGKCPSSAASVTVSKNVICATYSGDYFVSTPSITTTNATVTLVYTITAGSGSCNNISGLTVSDFSFNKSFTNGNATLVGTPTYVNGVYTAQYNINITSGYSATATFTLLVSSNYTFGSTCNDPIIITVSEPAGDFVTGGGYIIPPGNMACSTLVTPNSFLQGSTSTSTTANGYKNNFGFNIKWNKSLKNLQGNWNTIIRGNDGHLYQVKSSQPNSLALTKLSTGKYRADMIFAPANFQDLTTGWSMGGGKTSVNVTIIDNGEPGAGVDQIFISIKDQNGNLWYVSNTATSTTSGKECSVATLNQGNIQIHSGTATTPGTSRDVQTTATTVAQNFEVTATPNPSFSYFSLHIGGNNAAGLVNVKVTDVLGRVVETRQHLAPAQTLRIGSSYLPGIYIVEVQQGDNIKQLKLVKQ